MYLGDGFTCGHSRTQVVTILWLFLRDFSIQLAMGTETTKKTWLLNFCSKVKNTYIYFSPEVTHFFCSHCFGIPLPLPCKRGKNVGSGWAAASWQQLSTMERKLKFLVISKLCLPCPKEQAQVNGIWSSPHVPYHLSRITAWIGCCSILSWLKQEVLLNLILTQHFLNLFDHGAPFSLYNNY